MTISDDQILDLVRGSDLEPASVQATITRLGCLRNAVCEAANANIGLERILLDPDNAVAYLARHRTADGAPYKEDTVAAICAAAMTVFARCEALRARGTAAHETWRKHARRAKRDRVSEPDVDLTWKQILAIREKLPKGSQERLLLSAYTLIPPLRSSELYRVRLKPGAGANESRVERNELVLAETPKHPETRVRMPAALVAEIKSARGGADYLFAGRGGKPYATETAFGAWANKTLKEATGRDITLGAIRHLYLSSAVDLARMSEEKRRELCARMRMRYASCDAYIPKRTGPKLTA